MPYIIGPNGEPQWVMPPNELRPEQIPSFVEWYEETYEISPKQKEEKMEEKEQQENKIKTIKKRCEICGKTVKRIVTKEMDELPTYFDMIEYTKDGKTYSICKNCEDRYHITKDYFARGYGYAGTTRPRRTSADKFSTPTYGVEIEVAGNIKNIGKIGNLVYQNYECTIGYDTSVEGAQFEFSYAPGTYYWYLHESKLRAVCQLLQKDNWVNKNSTTTGMHIHVGTIDRPKILKALYQEQLYNESAFWTLIRLFGEREFNQYCTARIGSNHHNAISASRKWGTIEFRIFRTTFDFEMIMNRIKFIRQIIDNSTEDGVDWANFSESSKQWFTKLINKSRLPKEAKEAVVYLMETPLETRLSTISEENRKTYKVWTEDFITPIINDYDSDEEEDEENEEEVW